MNLALTADGLVIDSIDDLRSELRQNIQDVFGASLPVGDDDILGFLVGAIAERVGIAEQVLQQLFSAFDPDQATDMALVVLCLLTGTIKPSPIPSTVAETLCGDPGTVVAALNVIATASTGTLWSTQVDVTLVALTAWAPTTSYAVGDRRTNSARCYQCITPGTSAGSGGPTTTADDITDGSVHWMYIGEGTAATDAATNSQDDGPIVGAKGDLIVIQTPVSGWKSARNLADATLGALAPTNEQLRLLREAELHQPGKSPVDSLRSTILRLANVTSCNVFNNTTDATIVDDGSTMTPHSVEAVVVGGADQDIFDALRQSVAAGIATVGNTTGTSTDSQGFAQPVAFTRPGQILIYVRVSVTFDVSAYPADGDTEVANAIVAFGVQSAVGKDAVPSSLQAQAFTVDGVDDASALIYTDVIGTPTAWIPAHGYSATAMARSVVTNDGGRTYICTTTGTSGSTGPTGVGTGIVDGSCTWDFLGNTIPVGNRHQAMYANARITVVSQAGTP